MEIESRLIIIATGVFMALAVVCLAYDYYRIVNNVALRMRSCRHKWNLVSAGFRRGTFRCEACGLEQSVQNRSMGREHGK